MPAEIHRLHLAVVNLDGRFNPPTFVDARIDVFAYLIVCDSEVVLVDTGVGSGNAYVDRTFEPDRVPVENELVKFGVIGEDVTMVVNSHLHFDHCGNNSAFPNARIFVQEAELAVARTTAYTVRDWFDYEGARIRPVAGDLEIAEGVLLMATSGHTPGHQSVVVDTRDGIAIVAAQAAFNADEFRRGGDPEVQAHEGLQNVYRQSIDRIRAAGAQHVYFSHDAAGWCRTLP